MLNTNGLERKGYIIPESGNDFNTLDEYLILWTWQYLINQINIFEYIYKIEVISIDTPGALDAELWEAHTGYLELLRN